MRVESLQRSILPMGELCLPCCKEATVRSTLHCTYASRALLRTGTRFDMWQIWATEGPKGKDPALCKVRRTAGRQNPRCATITVCSESIQRLQEPGVMDTGTSGPRPESGVAPDLMLCRDVAARTRVAVDGGIIAPAKSRGSARGTRK